MNCSIMIVAVLVTVGSNSASACVVDATLTRDNFVKLIACVDNLERENARLTSRLEDLEKILFKADQSVRVYDYDIPDDIKKGMDGLTGTFSLGDVRSTCPPGSWVVSIQGFKLPYAVGGVQGSAEPVSALRYLCRSLKTPD